MTPLELRLMRALAPLRVVADAYNRGELEEASPASFRLAVDELADKLLGGGGR